MKITLATLHLATAQQVADQIVNHLLDQGERCSIGLYDEPDEDVCMYRSENLMCAAGCLIGDDEYKPEMEGTSWCGLITKFDVTATHSGLIDDLQTVHDDIDPEEWEESLKQILEYHGLEFNRNKA